MDHPYLAGQAVIVMGVSGSGKSTLGAALGRALGCPFLEGDSFHDTAAVAKMSAGHPLTDEDRWPWLDRLGAAIGRTARERGGAVASCSALKRSYRDRLRMGVAGPARFVLLDLGPAELLCRMEHRPGHYMPPSLLTSQLETLERPGEDEHALLLDAHRPPDELCAAVLGWLR